MSFKNTFFKWLNKLENVKISPVWGYSFAVCLIAYAIGLTIAQWDVTVGGGIYFKLWLYLRYAVIITAAILVLLTKKAKRYGMKIARIFSLTFLVVSEFACTYIPRFPCEYGDLYFDPIDMVDYLILIVAGFVGYAVGKYIAKKIKNSNMATVKEELSQG